MAGSGQYVACPLPKLCHKRLANHHTREDGKLQWTCWDPNNNQKNIKKRRQTNMVFFETFNKNCCNRLLCSWLWFGDITSWDFPPIFFQQISMPMIDRKNKSSQSPQFLSWQNVWNFNAKFWTLDPIYLPWDRKELAWVTLGKMRRIGIGSVTTHHAKLHGKRVSFKYSILLNECSNPPK